MAFKTGDNAIIARAEQPANNGIKVKLLEVFYGYGEPYSKRPLKHWKVEAVGGQKFMGYRGCAEQGSKFITHPDNPDFESEFLGIEEDKLDPYVEAQASLDQCGKCDARVVDGQCTSCDFVGDESHHNNINGGSL